MRCALHDCARQRPVSSDEDGGIRTEGHAEDDVVLSQQAERRRDGLERAHAHGVADGVDHVKVAAGYVQRVDGVFDAAKLESQVEVLVARDRPGFTDARDILEGGSGYATVDLASNCAAAGKHQDRAGTT